MSNILVNTIKDTGNNILLSSDGSGNISSGGAITNTPAFEAYLSSTQTLSFNADTKIQFDTEVFDTDGCYDNATNYRFTPTVAGKYYVYGIITFGVGSSELSYAQNIIKKNGSDYREVTVDPRNSLTRGVSISNYGIIDMNGSTDYLELYGRANTTGVDPDANGGLKQNFFGAYRIIGA
jgi:hypothetical protein